MKHTIEKAFDAAALAFGGVDIVVNNAGISHFKSHCRPYSRGMG